MSQVYVAERSRSIWHRFLGIERLSTVSARVLPEVVSIVIIEDVLETTTDAPEFDTILDSIEPRTKSFRLREEEMA